MSGRVIRIADITLFDFDNVGASQELTQVVALHVDVSQWTQATLMVRAHSLDIAEAGATINVQVVADGYTALDPSVNFFDDSAFLAEISLGSTNSAPLYRTDELTSGSMGSLVMIAVSGTQAAQTGALNAELSIDLALKSA